MRTAIPLASILFATTPAYAAYNLIRDYSGTNFFTGWEFYGNYDNLTNGDVVFVTQSVADSSKLAYVNDAGRAILKVDNTSFVPYNEKRNSVRIESTDFFPVGSVILFDATHLPYGCSVWPSFWTSGVNWPSQGEIDILEGINLNTANQMAIHTGSGCTQSGTDCSASAGCTTGEKADKSYGDAFSNAGGGVWATQFDTTGINIWFWSRADIPDTVTNAGDTIDPSTWGTPSAAYTTSSCDIASAFGPQQLILDITLCGDWAGASNIYQGQCGGDGTASACYVDNVINNGTKYDDAWMEINYVKVFSSSNETFTAELSGTSTVLMTATATPTATGSAGSSPTGSTGTGSTGTSSTGNGTTNTDGGSGALGLGVNSRVYLAVAAGTVLSGLTWALV